MSLTAGTRLGPYEITALLGAGGMGEVYCATDTNLKRPIALKVLPAAFASDGDRLARLQREAEVLASLNQPNIAAIYGVERANGVLALVMELVDGPTLADRIAEGVLPLDEAVPVARQIAAALEAAHDQGIVHRDLKPANIKLRPDGTVKLLDFGLAKAIAEAGSPALAGGIGSDSRMITSPALMTQAGMILGTAAYMSPEQAKGRATDARTDIWAFGVVLAEMTGGQRLFEHETVPETIAAVLTSEPELDRVPLPLVRLIRACLVKDPRARLRHIGDALSLVDLSAAAGAPERARRRSRWAYAAALATCAALAVAGAWLALRPTAPHEPVTRFYVDAPPGAAFNYTYTGSAISPDGRQLVFRVATATEAPALWLRPLDALPGRRMAGTEDADFPFWSPDGGSIAFFSAGKLKRVDAGGGTPIVICDAPVADSATMGGSWSTDDVIIFGAPEGVYRVSASGGVPALIAQVKQPAGETGYGDPQFLPDGDRFLFFVRSEHPATAGYYVSALSHPEQKSRVLATRSKAIFVANPAGGASDVLYLQGRTVLARRIDPRTLALGGDPVPLASDVARFPPGFHASFWSSASGNLLAYRTEASDKPRLTWIDPDGTRHVVTGVEDFYTSVRVSPDGSHAAMELADGTGNMDIWTWDFARGIRTRQTFDPKPDRVAAWSPNGHELVFSSLRTGVWQLYRKDVTTGEPEEQITTGPGDKIVPNWSRDGRYLVFIQISPTTAEDVWAMPLDGDRRPYPVAHTVAVETNPALSPDGQWIALESAQSGRPEVFVMRFPRSASAAGGAAPQWQVSTQGGSRPRWSGDGRALFYTSLDERRIMRAAVRGSAAGFESHAPTVFAEIPLMPSTRAPFDVTADGHVLLLERTINQAAPLTVVMNWRRLIAAR